MTSPVSAVEAIEKAMEGVTPGPWYPGHLGTDSTCQCRSIVDDGSYMGAIATVNVDNGLPIGEGGNDAPPAEEAAANMRYIAACNPVAMREVLALARQAEALQRENAEKDAEIAKLRGMIRDNGTPRFNAVCDRAETAEREVAELRAVMKDCHSALKMLVSPGVIQGTTVIGAFAAATSAERRARALLGGSENAE
ncbi:hypothetical protein [Shinella sp.]|uniref:hypothetical protein n=1 Tax=Shinella sp. TaxID=1870904 RepID=UPI0028AD10B8|nr:hypothetical protein [Shinella sp.]